MTAFTSSNSNDETQSLSVYFDGACPLCRREIDFYRRRRGADRIEWVDVSKEGCEMVGPDLSRSKALGRFHVRLSDGELVSGGRAFAELWAALPGFRWVGAAARTRLVVPLLELGYRGFLYLRPGMQRLARRAESKAADAYPAWLEKALRSDHAGETGAVAIYQGVLAVSRDREVRDFARRHIATEMRHLAIMEEILAPARKSRLLPLWRLAGFLTGALPAVFGPRAVYATIDAVETFVDHHYQRQIDALEGDPRWRTVRETLELCRRDEVGHRDEARHRCVECRGPAMRLWARVVTVGSTLGVATAERV